MPAATRSRRKRAGPTPGMVFAVPRPGGGFYLLVHLASNRFGEAFGLTAAWKPDPVLPDDWRPHPRRAFVYTGSLFVARGRWRHVGDRPDLLAAFPAAPEIYHRKADHPDNPAIGPHGSAETADEQLRSLGGDEYRASPLVANEYRQVMLEEEVEGYLHRREGSGP